MSDAEMPQLPFASSEESQEPVPAGEIVDELSRRTFIAATRARLRGQHPGSPPTIEDRLVETRRASLRREVEAAQGEGQL